MLSAFFITDHDPSLVVNGVYDPLLVSISVLIAIFASFFTTRLIDLAKETKFHNYERLAKFTAAAIFSAGIWSMHFIGMLAFSLCTNIKYDPTITILSFLPAFFACLFAISILINNKASFKILGLCSVLLGAGIGTMHYSGMAAMELAPLLRYDPLMFVLSIFVAIALSFIAFYSRFNLELGAKPTNIAPGELYTSLERRTIDALEWVGPSLDLRMGFHKIAPYYYTGSNMFLVKLWLSDQNLERKCIFSLSVVFALLMIKTHNVMIFQLIGLSAQ